MGLLVQSVEHRPLPPRVGFSMVVRRMFLDLVRFERPHTVRYRARLPDRTRAASLESGQGGGGLPRAILLADDACLVRPVRRPWPSRNHESSGTRGLWFREISGRARFPRSAWLLPHRGQDSILTRS